MFRLNGEQNIRFNELLCKAGLEHNRRTSRGMVADIRSGHRPADPALQQHAEQKDERRSHAANAVSGIVDTVLDLADTRAYEEQQRQMQRRKKGVFDNV